LSEFDHIARVNDALLNDCCSCCSVCDNDLRSVEVQYSAVVVLIAGRCIIRMTHQAAVQRWRSGRSFVFMRTSTGLVVWAIVFVECVTRLWALSGRNAASRNCEVRTALHSTTCIQSASTACVQSCPLTY